MPMQWSLVQVQGFLPRQVSPMTGSGSGNISPILPASTDLRICTPVAFTPTPPWRNTGHTGAAIFTSTAIRMHPSRCIYTKKYCHSYWCGNQANNRRQREYRQMRRQDLVCQCCGEKFTPKRADARYCSNACRQKVYRKRVTDAASAQNEHLVKRNASAK